MKQIHQLTIALALAAALSACQTTNPPAPQQQAAPSPAPAPEAAVAKPAAPTQPAATETAPPAPVAPQTAESPLPARAVAFEPSTTLPADFVNAPQVEVYGNFHTAGVIAALPEGVAAEQIGKMRCYLNVGGQWAPMHDLVQVGKFPHFATSLFWLKPASTYQVKVEVLDTDGKIIAAWCGEGATRAEPALHESATKLFVATTGDDANPGTEEKPFKTLAKAFATVKAGETVIVRGGTYYEGQLQFTNSGKEGAPIVVRAAAGERVVLDGTDTELTEASVWTQAREKTDIDPEIKLGKSVTVWKPAKNIYTHAFTGKLSNACVEEIATGKMVRLFPVPKLEELMTRTLIDASECKTSGPFEKNGIEGAVFADGAMVYLALPQPIENYRVRVPKQNRGINLESRNHIQIDGLELNHYGKDDYNTAIFVLNSSDVLIQNCRFSADDCQVYVKGDSERLTIQNCEFKDFILDWPFSYMKCGSGVNGKFEGGAVNVDAKFSGRGLVFRRNRIEGLFDGVHLTPWKVDNARTNEIDFYENHVDGCIDDFIEADGFSRNVRIFDNYMNRSLSGVSMAQALDGPTFVIYNVLANCGMVRAAQHEENYGYPFKTNGGPQADVGSGPMFLYHNTSYTLDPNSRAMLVKRPKWKLLTLRNNIWFGNKVGFEIWLAQPSPIDFDYDNLFAAEAGAPLVVQAYKTKYLTLDEVRANLKWLVHGISAEPKLQDVQKGDYLLLDDSPCIDAGIAIPGINDLRTKGTAPDLGAYEKK